MGIRRIIFFLGFLLVLTLVGIAFQFVAFQRDASFVSSTYDKAAQSMDLAVETYEVSDDLTRSMRTYLHTGDDKYISQYNQIVAIREGKLERPLDYPHLHWSLVNGGDKLIGRSGSGVTKPLLQLYKDAGFAEDEIAKLKISVDNSSDLSKREIEAFNASKGLFKDAEGNYSVVNVPDRKLANELLFNDEYHKEKYKIIKPVDEAVGLMRKRIDNEINKALSSQKLNRQILTLLLFLAILLIVAIAFAFRKQNKDELKVRVLAQQKAEKENEQLNDSIINILQSVHQLSQRDLTVKAPVTQDVVGTVSDSINFLTDETSRVLKDVTNVAGQVKDSSEKVRNQAGMVSHTAEQERESVSNMVDSLYQATQSMERVAQLAQESNKATTEATEVTENALNTVNNTVKGMESIRETIAETEKRIKRLGERSQEISGIVNLINTISERTHVLALNASMQAAVAGEAGRGFAVVAEEVQRLAESSRNATQQIASLVGNIQIETNETINTVNNTISQVVEGSSQAQKAGEQMRHTQQITEKLVNQIRLIAEASEQQKTMSGELLEAVQHIGESTEQTAQQIESQNEETLNLQQAAQRLVESVSVFKLPA